MLGAQGGGCVSSAQFEPSCGIDISGFFRTLEVVCGAESLNGGASCEWFESVVKSF